MPSHDDHDRPDDRDEGYDDYRDDGSRRDPRVRRAADRVKAPGMFLLVFGLISLFLAGLNVALLWLAPNVTLKAQYDLMQDLNKGQPQALPPYEEYVKQQQMQGTAIGVLQLIGSVLITLGGIKMRSLDGYGLAMAGSIMAIIPLCTNQCCCLSMPFGIWALVVLLNADVKRAFALNARPEAVG